MQPLKIEWTRPSCLLFFPVGRDELAAAADIYQKSKRKRKIARVAAAAAAAAVSC